jgi:putative ABC transport system permease protein
MMFDTLLQDLRYAIGSLRAAPRFALITISTLTVGIAATDAMYTLIDGVLLRPLPVREPNRLIVAWRELRAGDATHLPFFVPDVDIIRDSSKTLAAVAGVGFQGAGPFVIAERGSATYINGAAVTGEFFKVTGVEPVLGRTLNRDDDRTGAENVLMLTYGLWQRRYGGSADVLGRQVLVEEKPFTIVGVMPPGFEYPHGVEAWMTVAAQTSTLSNAAFRVDVDLIARLQPGVTLAQATSELQQLTADLEAKAPPKDAPGPRGMTAVVRPYKDVVVGDVRLAMFVLFGAVVLVLLLAIANAANLLLLRNQRRRAELAVRVALGAGRGRIARQLVLESLLLAVVAGMCGVLLTTWMLHLFIPLIPGGLPRMDSVRVDARVVLFTIAIVFVTAVAAALVPAIVTIRADAIRDLRIGGRGATGGTRHVQRALVIAQVTLAVTVVSAAGLLVRSLMRLQTVDMGLAADRLVFISLDLPRAKYGGRQRHLQLLRDVVSQLESAPEIAGATPINVAPFSGTDGWELPRFTAEGQSADRAATNPSLNLESIHPNYFETIGAALVRGRSFTNADRDGAPAVAIVSEDVASRTWPGDDPIGKRLKFGSYDSTEEWRTVVGVARPTRYRELTMPRPTLYLPDQQFIVAAWMFVVRTGAPLEVVSRVARARVAAVDPEVQVMRVAPLTELLERPLARPRFNAFLIAAFGVAALFLAAIGVYAVIAASVRQRQNEIGVRLALGATAAHIRNLVIGEGLGLMSIGLVSGLAISLATTQLLRGLLFETSKLDPTSVLVTVLLVACVALAASCLPARRAARVNPVLAVKVE